MSTTVIDGPAWPREIYELFKTNQITIVSYVPDAGHRELIERCETDETMRTVSLTTEEEGIALAAGAHLGGQRAVLLMQSSGVGNCINTLSLLASCGFPFLTLITMRGEFGEFNPWQVPMGQAVPATLGAMGVIVQRATEAEEVRDMVDGAIRLAFGSSCGVAVLLSQRLLGAKRFTEAK